MLQVIGMSVAGLTVAEDAEWLNLLRYAVLLRKPAMLVCSCTRLHAFHSRLVPAPLQT